MTPREKSALIALALTATSGGAFVLDKSTVSTAEIVDIQADAIALDGKPLQVLKGGAQPEGETRKVSDFLSDRFPADAEISIYQTPSGEWGYQVIQYSEATEDTATGTRQVIIEKSTGYGPEAQDRTYQFTKPL